MKVYTENEVKEKSSIYFDGDSLAATTFLNKYALRNESGEYLESSPKQMHDRMISEILRIENKYKNPLLTKEILQEMFYNFKYLIPGGSIMSGLGNQYKHTSLSNCFVIDPPEDSYGGIFRADQELVQISKRRGGVGLDLSYLRPSGAKVTNDAKTSSGLVSFMQRYSNSTNEVAQLGRRGALMLSVSIKHPDAEAFIDAKLDTTKITGANISVKITDEFMHAVKDNKEYYQIFPVDTYSLGTVLAKYESKFGNKELKLNKLYDCGNNIYIRKIDARKLWMKIIRNNTRAAEPGVLFWDRIKDESPADFYDEFRTVSTNPCGEIPLCPYDSCRLMAINLYSFVDNPFSRKAVFNRAKLAKVAKYAQRIMDNIIDLESEHIQDIIKKIEKDPESDEVKSVELNLWKKILDKTIKGRRTGIGITAEGDMLAALGIQYGTDESIALCEDIHKTIAVNCYESSIDLAGERGAFEVYDSKEIEFGREYKTSKFIERIFNVLPEPYQYEWKQFGRRNIASLTCAPTGTVSLMTQTTSGIEPLFKAWYIRRRKTSDKSKAVFTDKIGEMFEEFKVFHPKFIDYIRIADPNYDFKSNQEVVKYLNECSECELNEIYSHSPWYQATAQDIDWVQKVKLQGAVQKWIDHSISCTTNLPKGTTEDIVEKVYLTAYECGCKGQTVYVDGSRDGVLITESKSESKMPGLNSPRPKELPAKIVRFKNGTENWIAFIGLMNGSPYECFCGLVDTDLRILPKSITEGKIVQIETGPADENGKVPHRYDFQYSIPYGYTNTMPGINAIFNPSFWNYARFISGMLRAGVPVEQVVNVLNGLNMGDEDSINTWKKGVARALRQFIKNGTIASDKCPDCGGDLVYENGCKHCVSCGWSRCE